MNMLTMISKSETQLPGALECLTTTNSERPLKMKSTDEPLVPAPTPPSPFLPGTKIQYAWDSTSLGWLKACPRQYEYSMIEGWRPKGDAGVNLQFGLLYHSALETFDRMMADQWNREEAIIQVVSKALHDSYGWDSGHTAKNRENLIRSIIWYLDEFVQDNFETITLENGRPAVELSFRMELDWGPTAPEAQTDGPDGTFNNQPYVLSGHLDRLVRFSDGTYVTDRKTTGTTIGSDYFSRFDLDNQMSLYTVAASVIFHTPVRGVIIDGAQIAVGFTRFARGMTYRTPAQTEEWLADLRYWLRTAEEFAVANHWPMNEKSCFLCAFKRVCSKDPAVRQQFLESDFERRPWNPLAVR